MNFDPNKVLNVFAADKVEKGIKAFMSNNLLELKSCVEEEKLGHLYKLDGVGYKKRKWDRDEDNMLPPALDADDAFVFLKYYLLGPDWYVNYPGSSEQIITEMTYDILKKYSKKFRKECEKNDFR